MHDIWNPWHGCVKCSEGCENCYMYYLDKIKSILYDIELFFNTVFDMSDDELMKNEARVSRLVANYWGEA